MIGKKKVIVISMVIIMMALSACGKAGQKQLTVYSFHGENDQFQVSNGVIVLNDSEQIFDGGDLKITSDFLNNITSYSTTFYVDVGNDRNVILSNSVIDMTGGTVDASGDLGQVSGSGLFHTSKDDISELENNLYLELSTTDKDGGESVYQLKMCLAEVTKSNDN